MFVDVFLCVLLTRFLNVGFQVDIYDESYFLQLLEVNYILNNDDVFFLNLSVNGDPSDLFWHIPMYVNPVVNKTCAIISIGVKLLCIIVSEVWSILLSWLLCIKVYEA